MSRHAQPAPNVRMTRRLGSTLLFAVLIVAITLATSTTLASLVIRALQRSSQLGEASLLLYAAESDLERQLYAVRKLKGESIGTGNCSLPGWSSAPGCAWVGTVDGSLLYTTLTQPPAPQVDQAVQTYVGVGSSNVTLNTSCTDASGGSAAWIEITRLRVSSDGTTWQVVESPDAVYKQYYQCPGQMPETTTVLSANSHYIIRIRAMFDDVNRLKLRTVNSSGIEVSGLIRGQQTLKVTASGGLAQQVVKATFSASPPAVGFTDYVLFSECSIKKGVLTPPSCL